MSVETDLQRDMKKSVIKQGGYCIELSNRFTIGVPDLLICLPPFAPCYVEVKKLGQLKDGFNRQVDVTPKQRHELKSFHKAGGSSFVFVGLEWRKRHFLLAFYPDVDKFDAEYASITDSKVVRQVGNHYDVGHLLKTIGARQ